VLGSVTLTRKPGFFQADAFNNNNGLHILDAGETFQGTFGVALAPAPPKEI
jgi:hypothetical protein